MNGLLIGLFAALSGIAAGFILSFVYPKWWLKVLLTEHKEEVMERLGNVEEKLSAVECKLEILEEKKGPIIVGTDNS